MMWDEFLKQKYGSWLNLMGRYEDLHTGQSWKKKDYRLQKHFSLGLKLGATKNMYSRSEHIHALEWLSQSLDLNLVHNL